jgi:hypothetical protein
LLILVCFFHSIKHVSEQNYLLEQKSTLINPNQSYQDHAYTFQIFFQVYEDLLLKKKIDLEGLTLKEEDEEVENLDLR